MANFMNPAAAAAAVVGGNPNQLFPLFPFAPQNFMFSQLMNANPNASLLAKQWGEQFNSEMALDATVKGDNGQSGEYVEAEIPEVSFLR